MSAASIATEGQARMETPRGVHGTSSVVVHDYTDPDDAIRAIQGLRGVGFRKEQITVAASDDAILRHIDGQTDDHSHEGMLAGAAHVLESIVDRLTGQGVPDDHARGYDEKIAAGHIVVSVQAGDQAHLAQGVMTDGLVYTGHMHSSAGSHPYLDSSTGSGAGVVTSTGTGTGISPGSGYEGNTGSTTESTTGVLGQFSPGADTPSRTDDFPSREKHIERP